MRNTLLTTTALVLSAGIASADGHASISWSGTATAGVARAGAAAAVKTKNTANDVLTARLDVIAVDTTATISAASTKTGTDTAITVANAATATDVSLLANIETALTNLAAGIAANSYEANVSFIADDAAAITELKRIKTYLGASDAVAAGTVGDFKSYSEVNATVTGSVTAGDVTMTAAMSVDAGTGYTFADDKTFDAAKTNGVGLDNITVATSIGTFKIDEGAIVHLVDAGDETNADILYTNTFGTISFSAAIDANKDTDLTAVRGKTLRGNNDGTVGELTTQAAVVADVAWSAKVSMPLGTGSAYVAMDEEGGNIFGAAATLGGVGLTFSSKLEALEEEESADRDNSVGATYVMGATTLGASWNSVEDGDQWGISAAYAADGLALTASTDEGSDWSVSGSYLMGTGASVVGGVNYTEDAYLGLSFSF